MRIITPVIVPVVALRRLNRIGREHLQLANIRVLWAASDEACVGWGR
jgi:hypothetical protein